MPRPLIRSLVILCLATFNLAAPASASAPYWVMFRDGEQLRGEVMHFWHGGKPTRLDDQLLFNELNPPRVIRRTGATVRLSGPYIEFRNGDQLPGRVISYRPSPAVDVPAAFQVALPQDSAVVPGAESEVRVQESMARVIVWGERRRLTHYQPGAVLFRDGRRLDCRGIRLSESGMLLLTEQGLIEAALSELSEVHLPDRAWNVAEAGLRRLAYSEQNMLLESLVFTTGARITFPQGMTQMDTHYQSERFAYCAVQPRWSLDPLYFDPQRAAVSLYRRLNEVPLSLLPTTAIRQQATLHRWPWQRDRSVHGDLLASGFLTLCEGFGVHGNTTLAVELPAEAVSLTGWVGIDRSARGQGAMQGKVIADQADGETLWQSDLLRGGQPPQAIGPLEVSGLRQVLLVSEEDPEADSPSAIAPLDIGDDLDWMLTTVTLDAELAAQTDLAEHDLGEWIPELAGWSVAEDSAEVQLRPIYNPVEDRWRLSVGLRDPEGDNSRILLRRSLQVSWENAYFDLSVASHQLHAGHELSLWVGDEKVGSTMNADPKTSRRVGRFDSRVYILGEYAGQPIELTLRIEPADPRPPGSGVYFEAAALRPLVRGLPADGKPRRPEVSLDRVSPSQGSLDNQPWQPRTDGMATDRQPLNIRGYELRRGIAMPVGSSVTYELQPEWTRFVALVGLAHGWQGAGPFEVLIDGEQAWISIDPEVFKRNTPGQQVNVMIPPGSKSITLKVGGRKSTGAWGEAGFVSE